MKKLIISLALLVSSVAVSAETKDALYFGPVSNCVLSSAESTLGPIKVSLYTAGLFGPSETMQLLYSFPDFGSEMSFISLISTDDVDSGIYVGKMTNIGYLVDVVVDLNNGSLEMTDSTTGEVLLFEGTCTEPSI